MAFEFDDTELDPTESGGTATGYTSSKGAANPYTGQLQTLLSKYLENSEKSATDKQMLLDKARERVMARSAGPDQAEIAFRLAAALGKPTRTGGFGESLSNVAEATVGALGERRKATQELEDLDLKYRLAGQDVQSEKYKTQVGALSALAKAQPKDRISEIERMQEIVDNPKSTPGSIKTAQDRIKKLTYIKTGSGDGSGAGGAGGKPLSPAGKLASDEGLTPGTPEYQKRVKALAGEGKGLNLSATETKELLEAEDAINSSKTVMLNLSKAKELSPAAYEGFAAGARRSVARNIPGVKESEGVSATTELESLVGQNALDQLKAIFGGAPTEGERKILMDLQGSLSMTDNERQKLYDRAIAAAARRVKINEGKMKRIKSGAYGRVDATATDTEEKANGGLVGYADGGAVSDQEIQDYLAANPGLTDREIAEAMDQYGVSTAQMASATGSDLAAIQGRYDATRTPVSDQEINDWLADHANASDRDIAYAMNQYNIDPTQMAGATGINYADVQNRYNAAAPKYSNADVSTWLKNHPGATDKEIAAAMDQYGVGTLQMSAATGLPWTGVSNRYTAAGGTVQQPVVKTAVTPTSDYSAEMLRLKRDYLGGPDDVSTYGQLGRAGGAREHTFFDRGQGQVNKSRGGRVGYADGGIVHMEDGGEYSVANFGRAIGQGLGLGFGDEAIAKVRAKMEGRPYDQVVAEERAAYQRFQEKHPFAALGTELASGLVPTIGMALVPGAGTPGAVAGASRTALAAQKFMSALPSVMKGTMGRAAGSAAATGAIAGAGSATEGNRGMGAVEGGATGAVVGPTVAKGLQMAGKGAAAVKNAIRPSANAVEQRATNKVLEAMGRDEMDTSKLADKLNEDINLGVKSTIMDATPSLSTLGEAVVTRPGSGRKILGTGLNERLEGGREAAGQRALQSIGKGVDYTAQEDKLVGTLRSNANNMYDQAYAHGSVDDTRLMKVLEDDTFKSAFKEAQRISSKEARAAELRGEDPTRFKLNDIYEMDKDGNLLSVGKIPDVRTLDYIKRGIDALIDKGYKGEGMGKAEANALKDLRKAYINVIDENVPEYAAARAKYAGDMEVLDALRLGRTDYLTPKMLPAEAKKLVDGMSDAERDALRAGVAQSLLTKVMDAPQQVNAAQRIIGAPATRKRLEALFQDPNEYKVFEAALQRESELFRNAQDIVRGSRTANKTEALNDLKAGNSIFDIAGEAVDVAAGSPGSVMGRVLKYLQARTTLDEKTATEVAKMLKSGTQQEMQDTLNRLESSSAKFLAGREKSAKRLKTTAGTVGATLPTTPKAAPDVEPEPEGETDEDKLQRLMEKYNTEE